MDAGGLEGERPMPRTTRTAGSRGCSKGGQKGEAPFPPELFLHNSCLELFGSGLFVRNVISHLPRLWKNG